MTAATAKPKFDMIDRVIGLFFAGLSYIIWEVRTDVKSLVTDMAIVKTEHIQVAKDIDALKTKVFGENITTDATDKFFKNEKTYVVQRKY
jgi:hypothetical protein